MGVPPTESTEIKVILHTGGSAGDVLPFFGLARGLRDRGHQVVVVTNSQFQEIAQRIDMPFVPVGDSVSHAQALTDPDLWRPRRGLQIVMDQLFPDPLQSYRVLAGLADENTVVIGHPFAFAVRLLQERDGLRCATAVLSPCLLRSDHRVPVMFGQRELSKMAGPLKSLMWYLADRWLIDPTVLPRLNQARHALGMEPISRPFHGWILSPTLTIGLFPEWFAPPQPDWPEQVRQTGFPRFHTSRPLSPELRKFMDHGEPPIVFNPGSGFADHERYFSVASRACKQLDRRAIFLSSYSAKTPQNDRILHLPFAPLDVILPRCAAVVHHGGIGTTGDASYAGLPQIVRPCGFDQYDHAVRIEELGMGVYLSRKDFRTSNLVCALENLLKDNHIARCCQRRARQLSQQEPVAESCALIEELAH